MANPGESLRGPTGALMSCSCTSGLGSFIEDFWLVIWRPVLGVSVLLRLSHAAAKGPAKWPAVGGS